MKNKNGFTLIELLLVIALVISLLGIAVVNVIKLTDKQKKNSYESVKEQVITAAEQYFSSNEYLFEGISETGFGIIPVEQLVSLDYLNKLTNPVTGQALNKCDKVKVTRDSTGKFDFEFIESPDSSCKYAGMEFRSDDKAPEAEAYFTLGDSIVKIDIDKNHDNWYNYNELENQKLNVVIKTNGIVDGVCIGNSPGDCNLQSTYNKIQIDNLSNGYFRDSTTYKDDIKQKYVTYKVCNNTSCTTEAFVYGGKDITKPSCNFSLNPNKPENYVHKESPALTFSSEDETSGFRKNGQVVFSLTSSPTIKSGTNRYPETFTDIAGNKESCSRTVVYDDADPTCPQTLLTYKNATSGKKEFCDPSKSTGNWHCTDVVATLNKGENWARYEWDGVETKSITKTYSTSGTHKPTITAYDENGDRITCTATEFKIDKTQPSLSLTLPGTSDNSKWYNVSSISYNAVASDTGSGINTMKSYWNKTGLTTALATNSTNKWNGSKYPTGGTYTIPVNKGQTSITHGDELSAEGHRKIAYVVCDQAGNCNSAEKDAKMDRTKPTLNLTLSGYKTATGWNSVASVNYKADASDSLSGIGTMTSYWNKTGLTTSNADSTTYSWDGASYYGGSGQAISITKGTANKTDENKLYAEGHRKIRYTVCDQAGNCVSSAKSVKIDRTAPVVVRSGSGPILCKRPSEPGNNAHGYSVEAKDNLSGTTIRLYQYYSSWDCGSTNNFHWADSSDSTSVAEDGKKIFTVLAGCSNNPAPGARFSLVDGAGNKYTSGGKDYLEVKHARGSYSTSNIKTCSSSVWWNESPNR